MKKRLAVIVSSPYQHSDQVLGVPITPSNSGKDQRDVVMKVIKDWKFEPYILGLGFDTTSDNTGWRKGSVKLIEEALKEAACPHHYYEIYVRKMAEHYLGDTTRSCYELSLALVWLGVKVENFKFLYPGAISSIEHSPCLGG